MAMIATVELSSCGNPDFGQDPDQPLWGCPDARDIPVATLGEASTLCRQYIRDHELGCGNWSGGRVKVNGELLAYISYNGRVWASLELEQEYIGDELTREIADGDDSQPDPAVAESA
jgi:hypothetical protein